MEAPINMMPVQNMTATPVTTVMPEVQTMVQPPVMEAPINMMPAQNMSAAPVTPAMPEVQTMNTGNDNWQL